MDIHPPLKPIHNWQEFLVHLLTITIGLFIALSLEGTIQAIHHWNLVREARANLQREIAANHKLYADNARNIRENRNQLAHDIDQLRDLRDGKKLDHPNLSWTWDWKSYEDAATLSEETKAGAALRVAGDPAKLIPTEIEALLLKSAELDQSFGMLETTTMNKMDTMYQEMLQAR